MTTRTLPIDVVRSLVMFALNRGWPIDPLLAAARVDPDLLAVGRSRVTEEQVAVILRGLWASTDDELVGLGRERVPRGTFRLLCYATLGAPDLGEALRRLTSFLDAVPALSMHVDFRSTPPPPGLAAVDVVRVVLPGGSGSPDDADDTEHIATVCGLLTLHRVISWAVRAPVPGLVVELPFSRPSYAGSLEALFSPTRLDYRTGRAALVFDRSALTLPIARHQHDIDEFVARAPRSILRAPEIEHTTAVRVRLLLEATARSGGWLSSNEVARRLAISEQTLRRRLSEEGTSFRELSEEVRRDAAITALVAGDSVAVIAERLGYSAASAFTRAFQRWTGSTPGLYRRQGL